jgi:myosin-5
MQSCLRRRLARKQLKSLKEEARSATKLKELSYRLENKVVELTQSLQKRTGEARELQARLSEVQSQLQSWMNKHEESEGRAKQHQSNLASEVSQRDALLKSKREVEAKLHDAMVQVSEKEELVLKLTADLSQQTVKMEEQQRLIQASSAAAREQDASAIAALKNEVTALRDQLNRASALNSLTRGGRQEIPVSPTFAPALRQNEVAPLANGIGSAISNLTRHLRRHSAAATYPAEPHPATALTDELMFTAKRNQATNPRAVSVMYSNPREGPTGGRTNGVSSMYTDPIEEKLRLLTDARRMDEDALEGLIKGLKIPTPSASNPPPVREILFPANIIGLVTNEMWKYGLIAESERFLANVMQQIQSHVMVSGPAYSFDAFSHSDGYSHSVVRMPLCLVFSGCRMYMSYYRSFASRRVICCKELVLEANLAAGTSNGATTSDWSAW